MSAGELVNELLTAPATPLVASDPTDFWQKLAPHTGRWSRSIERATLSGLFADRLGYAFVGGYVSALQCLVPELGRDGLACLAATEAGGAHPRAIETRLEPAGDDGFTLSGHKRWSTLAHLAETALVVATIGAGEDGRPRLRVVRVRLDAPGVRVEPMAATAFVPEVLHSSLSFERVSVAAEALLPGDGYERYLKPFRTIEDLHVHAALVGYLVSIARRSGWPHDVLERAVAVGAALGALAGEDALSPAIHVALAGAIRETQLLLADLAPHWPSAPAAERERWERDQPLLAVAERARAARCESAWNRLGSARS